MKHQITQVTQPLQPRFAALRLLAFPKTKIIFEKEEISNCQWDSVKYNREADGDWENDVRSQGAYFERDWGVIVPCTMFLVSSLINISIFHITWLDTFWTDLVCWINWRTQKVIHLRSFPCHLLCLEYVAFLCLARKCWQWLKRGGGGDQERPL